ncbi:DUF1576 domain-containing protein [Fundicoccus sp. Sow4_H7]|uniref:DUF1576 domain-containing protein n=1 Tax=Fundicoccus sp. Sow4_H7 TaxID=3438784 RepID=UPI003F90F558
METEHVESTAFSKFYEKYVMRDTQIAIYFFYFIGILFILFALLVNSPQEIWNGFWKIMVSPSSLITDYFEVGGVGATFVNAAIVLLLSTFYVHRYTKWITGPISAALFTILGFAFFGKNIFNTIPIMFGSILYSKFVDQNHNRALLTSLFATALGPVVSLISFGQDIPFYFSIPIAYAVGLLIGFIITPVASAFLRFHQGYNLYNIGFTAGVLGMLIASVMRAFGLFVDTVSATYIAPTLGVNIFFFVFNLMLIGLGWLGNRKTKTSYRDLLDSQGVLISDFVQSHSAGLAIMNAGILGLISMAYVLAVGGIIEGPVIGGILTVIGFGLFGKHPRNVIPVIAGVYVTQVLMHTESPASNSALLAALFGTTVAPISGKFGPLAGFIAGGLHASLVQFTGFVHAGVNLYNNGFAGGFVAASLAPIFEMIQERKKDHATRNKKN